MSKIRKSARGQQCMVRLPGICCFDNETTVLAHLNGAGMGIKHHDFQGAFCCATCHAAIDGRIKTRLSNERIQTYFADGVFRTQRELFKMGLIVTKGSK